MSFRDTTKRFRTIAAGVMAMPLMLKLRATACVLVLAGMARAQGAGHAPPASMDLPAIVEVPPATLELGPGASASALPPLETSGDAPELLGPVEMPGPSRDRRSLAGAASTPLILESIPGTAPGPEVRDLRPEKPLKPADRFRGPRSIMRPKILGRGSFAPRIRGKAEGLGEVENSVVIEPKSDPAADGTLKRRLERQIRESLGDRIRSLEVLVVDRRVVIQAKTTRFWQRRAVRKSIEGLPDLVGYRATIHVDE